MRINIIGAGKLGKTLGRLWAQSGHYQITAVVNQSLASSQIAVDFIGQGQALASVATLPAADITLIAVNDAHIASVCQALYAHDRCPPQHLVMHCAGALTAEVLTHPQGSDINIAAVHPIYSFNPYLNPLTKLNCQVAIEADPKTFLRVSALFTNIGAEPFALSAKNKSLYHAGCVIASNYLNLLAEEAFTCLRKANLNEEQAKKSVLQLMQNTLDNIQPAAHPLQTLTGPLQRGDISTIEQHLRALKEIDQQFIYQTLGSALLKKLDHPRSISQKLEELLLDDER